MSAAAETSQPEKKPLSLFDLPSDFFDSSCLLFSSSSSSHPSIPSPSPSLPAAPGDTLNRAAAEGGDSRSSESKGKEPSTSRWTCNTCRAEFESLLDQRSHFKSDLHRLNVKLTSAGKKCVKEEDLQGLDTENDSFFETLEVSSISGSEDESEEEESVRDQRLARKNRDLFKQKLYFRLNSGDTVSFWRCLLLNESEEISQSSDNKGTEHSEATNKIGQNELISRLKQLISEPRDKTCIRIVLLARGGHFAGCVFDGKSILAHKTFHRYVVRAKAGKKQSSKDASGKIAHSAGSSIRRHNEAALRREVQDLVLSWKSYFDTCKCILIHAPSRNRQLFDGEKIQPILQGCTIQNVPLTVRRPTFKEAKRVYNHLSEVNFETEHDPVSPEDDERVSEEPKEKKEGEKLEINGNEMREPCSVSSSGEDCPSDSDITTNQTSQLPVNETTPLHLAAKSNDAASTLELLEQGLNPCIKDERGKTPYMLTTDKEVRNTFRRFMALNIDKWDWHAANVPSALTKEMEESQAAKQAEKDAKRKARAKELKKLKKAKEKEKEIEKAKQAQASASQKGSTEVSKGQPSCPVPSTKQKQPLNPWKPPGLLSEEERQRQLAEEREKRAAAAERRLAALKLQGTSQTITPSRSDHSNPESDASCSYCHSSLAGKIPFHRYNYNYCSPTCMHVHGEMLQDS
ncbi:hypothetical protein LUZ63_002045 [Rhynchospora breviuscula]|uniref:VLRF1 domain-containing protein n=1 Tax=Rhynchospora breviuscula TaxID=2022672 RepID=A0A9Q0HXM4_9POAL|nr:hypothetical protein LUZ63_002045 [Rhynchospora breviuscula]